MALLQNDNKIKNGVCTGTTREANTAHILSDELHTFGGGGRCGDRIPFANSPDGCDL